MRRLGIQLSSTAGYLASFLFFFVFILLPALVITAVVGQWAGILLQGAGAPLSSWIRIELLNVLASNSGPLLLAAAIAFVLNMWGHLRAFGWGK